MLYTVSLRGHVESVATASRSRAQLVLSTSANSAPLPAGSNCPIWGGRFAQVAPGSAVAPEPAAARAADR